jgi:hypothetical protein
MVLAHCMRSAKTLAGFPSKAVLGLGDGLCLGGGTFSDSQDLILRERLRRIQRGLVLWTGASSC